jgi:hypothetical protein
MRKVRCKHRHILAERLNGVPDKEMTADDVEHRLSRGSLEDAIAMQKPAADASIPELPAAEV